MKRFTLSLLCISLFLFSSQAFAQDADFEIPFYLEEEASVLLEEESFRAFSDVDEVSENVVFSEGAGDSDDAFNFIDDGWTWEEIQAGGVCYCYDLDNTATLTIQVTIDTGKKDENGKPILIPLPKRTPSKTYPTATYCDFNESTAHKEATDAEAKVQKTCEQISNAKPKVKGNMTSTKKMSCDTTITGSYIGALADCL